MCGRVASFTPLESIARLVNARGPYPAWKPRYNRPPGEPIENVVEANGVRRIEPYLWGLQSSDRKQVYINVKAEGLPARRAFGDRRSLIFVDGFYEWDRRRQPYYIHTRNGEPVALGAVYDRTPEQVRCAVITTEPNEAIAQVHHRMPLILPPAAWNAWLDPRYPDRAELAAMLRPYAAALLEIHPVSKLVNSPKNDRPELLHPAGDMSSAGC